MPLTRSQTKAGGGSSTQTQVEEPQITSTRGKTKANVTKPTKTPRAPTKPGPATKKGLETALADGSLTDPAAKRTNDHTSNQSRSVGNKLEPTQLPPPDPSLTEDQRNNSFLVIGYLLDPENPFEGFYKNSDYVCKDYAEMLGAILKSDDARRQAAFSGKSWQPALKEMY